MSLPEISERSLLLRPPAKISVQVSWTNLCVANPFLLVAISARDLRWWDFLVISAQILLATRGEVACFQSNGGIQVSKNNENILRFHRAPSSYSKPFCETERLGFESLSATNVELSNHQSAYPRVPKNSEMA